MFRWCVELGRGYTEPVIAGQRLFDCSTWNSYGCQHFRRALVRALRYAQASIARRAVTVELASLKAIESEFGRMVDG